MFVSHPLTRSKQRPRQWLCPRRRAPDDVTAKSFRKPDFCGVSGARLHPIAEHMATLICMNWGTQCGPEYIWCLRATGRQPLSLSPALPTRATAWGMGPRCDRARVMKFTSGSKRGALKPGGFLRKAELSGPTLFLVPELEQVGPVPAFLPHRQHCCIPRGSIQGKRRARKSPVLRFDVGPHVARGRFRDQSPGITLKSPPPVLGGGPQCQDLF